MKKQFIILITLLCMVTFSCQDLNLKPKGILSEQELFTTPDGVKKYFAKLYSNLPIEEFLYWGTNVAYNTTDQTNAYRPGDNWQNGKNSQGNMSGEFFNSWQGVNNNGSGWWPYDRIRDANVFLANFPNYKAAFTDSYTTTTYNQLLGEARFLRAFYYFGLAKRYGGVPIITDVQDPFGDITTLTVPRNTEYDTWKFIYSDLQFAIDNMSSSTTETGRGNKYVAAALMSRAMLYAGTAAKYTQYMGWANEPSITAGTAGMNPSQANEFFGYVVAAGNVVKSGPFSLYTGRYPDKAKNFADLFFDPASPETIFIKDYDRSTNNTLRLNHTYDALMSPRPDFSSFVGSNQFPTLDMMELYDMTPYVASDGKPVRFTKKSDIKAGMEPRLQGTLYFDGDVLRGKTFSIQRGIYKTFTGLASDAQYGLGTAPINATINAAGTSGNRLVGAFGAKTTVAQVGKVVDITGAHGSFENVGEENNGFGCAFFRKYVDPNRELGLVKDYGSDQTWIAFRFAEVLLNIAEAQYELGNRTAAFDEIEKIRIRAGALVPRPAIDQTMTNQGTLGKTMVGGVPTGPTYLYSLEKSLLFIRDERQRELWAENHFWWDQRRWRTVAQTLNQWRPRFLSCYYVVADDKYIYLNENNRQNRGWTAAPNSVYEPIPGGEIGKNRKLLPDNPLR